MNNQIARRQEQLKPVLMEAKRQITSLLEDPVKANKFLAASLVVASDSTLNKCSPDSIVNALLGIAMSDLNVDKNVGHAYLVPYGESVQLQIGYKGFIQMLFRAGWLIKAVPVYLTDDFSINFDGWDNKISFTPDIDNRDEGDKDWVFDNLRGIYAVARHADTKDEYSLFVPKCVIEKLRKNSPNQKITQWTKPADKTRLEKSLPIGIWHDWYIEMAQAKAIKKLSKILPIGDRRVQTFLAADDKIETGGKVDYVQTNEKGVVIDVSASDETSDIFEQIENASSIEELNKLLQTMNTLTKTDKKQAQTAWTRKKSEFETEAVVEVPIETSTPQKQTGNLIIDEINAAKSIDSLNAVLTQLEPDEWETYVAYIDDARAKLGG